MMLSEISALNTYWLMSQSYNLCMILFVKALMNLIVKVVDEKGLFRLNQSVVLIKSDFDSLLRKNKEKVMQNQIVVETDQRNAKTLEKLQYVIEFLSTKEDELKVKIKEREMVGFDKADIQNLLQIKTDAHDAVMEQS